MKNEKSLALPPWVCPKCGFRLPVDAPYLDTTPDPHPKAGDINLCVQCVTLTVFDAALQQRLATKDECAAIRADDRLCRSIQMESMNCRRVARIINQRN